MPSASALARRLQLSWAVLALAAALWGAWQWWISPLYALAGAALILAMPSLVLALELGIASRIGRSETAVPRPSFRQIARAWAHEIWHFHATFCWRQPLRWRREADHLAGPATGAGRTGVVLVHGFMCNRGFWAPWLRELRHSGHPCIAVNLEPVHGSIDSYAPIVDDAVRRMLEATGRPPILVGHSMGGLAARAWWRANGGCLPVAHLVTIASPHRGTWLARFSRRTNGRQMQWDSAWLASLAEHEQRHPLPAATCWYSNCDNVVFPVSTALLPGADRRFIAGEAHVALAFHPAVIRGCDDLLQQMSAARQGEFVTGIGMENS